MKSVRKVKTVAVQGLTATVLIIVSLFVGIMMASLPKYTSIILQSKANEVNRALNNGIRMHNGQMPTEIEKKKLTEASVFSSTHWDDPLPTIQCRKPNFFPYLGGCPSSCASRRTDLSKDEPLYRTHVFWDFGDLESIRNHNNGGEDEEMTDEFLKEHFPKLNVNVAREYINIEQSILSQLPKSKNNNNKDDDLHIRLSGKVHMTLFYFCCLTIDEARSIRSTLSSWLNTIDINIPISFTNVECWQTRRDAISSILVADMISQRRIYKGIYEHGIQHLKEKNGLPIVVRREEQMPFHAPILSVTTSPSSEQQQQQQQNLTMDIGEHKIAIAGATNKRLDKLLGHTLDTNITIRPTLSTRLTCHARCSYEQQAQILDADQWLLTKNDTPNQQHTKEEEDEEQDEEEQDEEGEEQEEQDEMKETHDENDNNNDGVAYEKSNNNNKNQNEKDESSSSNSDTVPTLFEDETDDDDDDSQDSSTSQKQHDHDFSSSQQQTDQIQRQEEEEKDEKEDDDDEKEEEKEDDDEEEKRGNENDDDDDQTSETEEENQSSKKTTTTENHDDNNNDNDNDEEEDDVGDDDDEEAAREQAEFRNIRAYEGLNGLAR